MKWPARARICSALLLAILVLPIIRVHADNPAVNASSTGSETAPIIDPTQVSDHYRAVLARPEFRETDDSAVNTRVEDWLSQWFKRFGAKFGAFQYGNHMPAFESFLMTVLVVLCIALLIYVMARLTRRRDRMEQETESAATGPKTFRPPESYDDEIRQAIRAQDWHEAWLASWRQFLSRLENRHLVEADRTRTNREYLAQLRGQTLPSPALALLNRMVDAYDRFVYGRKSIGEQDWIAFHDQIGEAALLLHLDDRNDRAPAQKGSP